MTQVKTREIDPNLDGDEPDPKQVSEAAELISKTAQQELDRETAKNADGYKTVAGAPDWAKIPPDFNPPKGVQVFFMRFRQELTSNPAKGERQAILWCLSIHDEKMAMARARGDVLRTMSEMAKQTVRAVDGNLVDWTGADREASLDRWWEEIGPKCRSLIQRHYTMTHNVKPEEAADFFENCIVAVVRD